MQKFESLSIPIVALVQVSVDFNYERTEQFIDFKENFSIKDIEEYFSDSDIDINPNVIDLNSGSFVFNKYEQFVYDALEWRSPLKLDRSTIEELMFSREKMLTHILVKAGVDKNVLELVLINHKLLEYWDIISTGISFNDFIKQIEPNIMISTVEINCREFGGSNYYFNGNYYAINMPYKFTYVDGGIKITNYIGESYNLKIPSHILGYEVVSIGEKAFESSKLEIVTIPKTVKEIGESAFSFNFLKEVIIENENIQFGFFPFFANDNLKSITIGSNKSNFESVVSNSRKIMSLENVMHLGGTLYLVDECKKKTY